MKLHHETKVLKVKDRRDKRGTQTPNAASANPQHPLHYMAEHQHLPRNIKTTPSTCCHTQILSSLTLFSKKQSQNTYPFSDHLPIPSSYSETILICKCGLLTSILLRPYIIHQNCSLPTQHKVRLSGTKI